MGCDDWTEKTEKITVQQTKLESNRLTLTVFRLNTKILGGTIFSAYLAGSDAPTSTIELEGFRNRLPTTPHNASLM